MMPPPPKACASTSSFSCRASSTTQPSELWGGLSRQRRSGAKASSGRLPVVHEGSVDLAFAHAEESGHTPGELVEAHGQESSLGVGSQGPEERRGTRGPGKAGREERRRLSQRVQHVPRVTQIACPRVWTLS
jgi:hypothetical protein